MEVSAAESQRPPTHCPTCDIELVLAFQCGDYAIFKCFQCGLNIRSFPPEPLTAFYDEGDDEKSVDLAALQAACIDRKPPQVEIPKFSLDDLGSDLD